jgi:hypothetical protein
LHSGIAKVLSNHVKSAYEPLITPTRARVNAMRNRAFDLTGQRYGKWTVVSLWPERAKHRQIQWLCHCDCGNDRIVRTNSLRNGTSTSCGCAKADALAARILRKTFGRLTVLSRHRVDKRGQHWWNCQCDCGSSCVARTDHLTGGRVVSCGCHASERTSARNFRHGLKWTPEYKIWDGIIERCCNPNSHSYARYGGRGIQICDEWRGDFTKFLADMGERPSPKHSIDRIDNDGNYEPDNCRWATTTEQARNKRNTLRIEFEGEFLTVAEWCAKLGVTEATVRLRVRRGGDAFNRLVRAKTSNPPQAS